MLGLPASGTRSFCLCVHFVTLESAEKGVKRGDGPARAPHFIINKSETTVCGRGRKGCEEVYPQRSIQIHRCARVKTDFCPLGGEIYSSDPCRSHRVATLKPRDPSGEVERRARRPWLPTFECAKRRVFFAHKQLCLEGAPCECVISVSKHGAAGRSFYLPSIDLRFACR